MDLATMILGWHIWFFREGDAFTVPGAGICAAESKPGISPDFDAGWIEVGTVESFDPNVSQEEYKLWKPSPGRLTLRDSPENKQEFSGKVIVNDVGPLAIETFFRTSQKLGGAVKQFNPLSSASKKGWLHFQGYGQDDEIALTLDAWAKVRSTLKWDGTPTKPEFDFMQLYSSLNTGATA